MNTKQIDYALELAQVKNFNRAAENLFIFQPSLSYQIQALENEIGLALFLRSGRGAEVTPAGEQFFQTLRNIREELKAAIEQGQNFSARYRSAVMIALPMRSCLYYLPEAMKAFEKTHPDVTVMPHFFPFSDFSSFLMCIPIRSLTAGSISSRRRTTRLQGRISSVRRIFAAVL